MKNVKLIILAIAAFVVTTNAWGSFTKVTSAPLDWSGEYLLVYETPAVAPATTVTAGVAWTGIDNGQCRVDVTISNGVIASQPEGAVTITIASMTGGYSIKVNGGEKSGKYINKTIYANGMEFLDSPSANTISFADEIVTISGSGTDNTNYVTLKYNDATGTSNERFRYYKSGQKDISLYKKAQDCTDPSLSFTENPINLTLSNDEASVDLSTKISKSGSGAVTYAITGGNEGGDAEIQFDGKTFFAIAAGTYTVKASLAASSPYCSDEESVTINVTAPTNHTVTWKVDGETYTVGTPTTQVAHGGKVSTLPTVPATPTSCGDAVFMGWTDHEVTNGSVPSPLFKTAADAPVVNADVTYHAVFADED